MALSVDDFITRLNDSGLMTSDEVRALVELLPADKRPQDVNQLAQELIRQKKLTAYQAQTVYQGKGKSLVLGNYVVLDKLGQGGMGMVLKAEHRRMKRVVALKVISPEAVKTPDALKRFHREVEAAARLTHPNIVGAFDADETKGIHFLVMEYVEGTDLSAFVKKRGPLPVEQAIRCIVQAARGLEFAHEQGVIHRDIKPANLLIDAKGMVKILDMGLARIDGAVGGSSEGAGLTSTGTIMGTVDYMSPEQAMDTKHADARSDIYSLGCSLYYLLTGKVVYDGDTMMKKLMAHQNAPLPSLVVDAASVRTISGNADAGSVGHALDTVFRRMVAKKSQDRPQSMAEVIAELERCLASNSATVTVQPSPNSGSGESLQLFLQEISGGNSGLVTRTLPASKATSPQPQAAASADPALNATMISSSAELTTDLQTQTSLMKSAPKNGTGSALLSSRRNQLIAGLTAAVLLIIGIVWWSTGKPPAKTDESIATDGSNKKKTQSSGVSSNPPPPAVAPFDTQQARAHQEAWAKHLGVPVEYTNSIGMKFVLIPPGEFTMGSTNAEIEAALKVVGEDPHWREGITSEAPQHTVILTQAIYLSVVEVTQREYEAVMHATPSYFASTGAGKVAVANLDTQNHPVETVSWNDAAEFCAKLSQNEELTPFYVREGETITPSKGTGYRLPTEAEWEFACRAGTTTGNWIGDEEDELVQAGWFATNSGGRTHAVGLLKMNPLGLYDIHGNVWEWVEDGWDPRYYGQFTKKPAINPNCPCPTGSLRLVRGGGWLFPASYCRSSHRNRPTPQGREGHIGFRVSLMTDAVKELLKRERISAVIPSPAKAPFDAKQARAHQEAWAKHLGVPVEYTNSIGMKFVLIPPGEFLMGSTPAEIEAALIAERGDKHWQNCVQSETPRHKVILSQPIYLGVNEVTQAEYEKVMSKNPSDYSPTGKNKQAVAGLDTTRHPVEAVHWIDAAEFCAKLSQRENLKPFYFRGGATITLLDGTGYRLPTEAEWEFACRARTTSKFWSGDKDQELAQVGWFQKNSGGRTHAVGELKANPFGLYDIHGNVWEWVQDTWNPTSYEQFRESSATNPSSPFDSAASHVVRGGSRSQLASNTRSSHRYARSPAALGPEFGFRVSLPVDAVRQAVANVSRADGSIDVLSLVDIERDNLQPANDGRWEWTDANRRSLKSTGKTQHLQIPVKLADDYRLRMRVQKLGIMPEEGLVLGLRVAGVSASMVLGYERYGKIYNGFEPPHVMQGERFPTDPEFELEVTVKGRTVEAKLEGKTIFQFDGDPKELVGPGEKHWARRDPARLSIAAVPDFWRINSFEYLPLRPHGAVGNLPPAPAVAPFDAQQARAHQEAWAKHLGLPVEKEITLPGGEKLMMMLIPPGDFVRDEGGKQFPVRITKPFYLGKYEVTQAQWQSVMGNNPSQLKDNPTHPVEMVNWDYVQPFLAKLNVDGTDEKMKFALPTEAQWEYACRAGTITAYSFGDSAADLSQYGWSNGNSGGGSHPVGQLKPNQFGLYDMLGNVWELCADWHDAGYYAKAPLDNPPGPFEGALRDLRGGSWAHSGERCLSAYRHAEAPVFRQADFGFRLAASINVASLSNNAAIPDASSDNYALQFDGEKSLVEVPNLYLGSHIPCTIECWIQAESTGSMQRIISSWGKRSVWIGNVINNWEAGLGHHTADGMLDFATLAPEPPSVEPRMTHVAGVFEEKTATLYVNGQPITRRSGGYAIEFPLAFEFAQGSPLYIGAQGGSKPDSFAKGKIDELRISKTARYSGEFTPQSRFVTDGNTIALYHFDEGTGDVLKDSSGNNHHGKIVGAKWVKSSVRSAMEPPQYALDFNDRLESGNARVVLPKMMRPDEACTVEMYFTARSVSEQKDNRVLFVNANGMQLVQQQMYLDWSGPLLASRKDNRVRAKDAIKIGQRMHLAGVSAGKELRLFVDGQLVGQVPLINDLPSVASNCYLGSLPVNLDSFNPLDGLIDEVRISKGVRYTDNFKPASRFVADADTLALYQFDEGAGEVLKDSSGNNHHGEIIGAKWVKLSNASTSSSWIDWLGPRLKRNEIGGNGWIREGDAFTTDRDISGIAILPDTTRDGAIRLTYLLRDAKGVQINARDRKRNNTDAARDLYVAEDNGTVFRISLSQSGAPYKDLARQTIPASISKDAPRTLEFRVVGDTLTATLNGSLVVTAKDSTIPSGNFALVALKGLLVQKVEYQELDNVLPPLAIAPFDARQARAHQEAWAKHLGMTVETANSVGAKMILIPPGEFLMGSTDEQVAAALKFADQEARERIENPERPQHRVFISRPFLLGATEVTVGQFKKFAATGYKTEAEQDTQDANAQTYLNPGYVVTDDSPVAVITKDDAAAYCKWLSEKEKTTYRLPTEAEWEYACRAGTPTAFSFGDDVNQLAQFSWHSRNAGGKSHPVGTKLSNAFGIFDMHGNLYEWVADDWDEKWYEKSPVKDPIGPTDDADGVFRGGSWLVSEVYCRSAARLPFEPSTRSSHAGFRVVRVLDAPIVP